MKSNNYKEQPCWALLAYCVMYCRENTNRLSMKIDLHVRYIATTQQLEHYIPQEYGLFQAYSCKCPA
jgi:hypothetical protein